MQYQSDYHLEQKILTFIIVNEHQQLQRESSRRFGYDTIESSTTATAMYTSMNTVSTDDKTSTKTENVVEILNPLHQL